MINQKLGKAGRVESLEFDRECGVIEICLFLVGEENVVSVMVTGVSLSDSGHVSFESAHSNREWIQELLNAYSHKLELAIPEKYLPVVKAFLVNKPSIKSAR